MRTAAALQRTNRELQQATSLLLHADAHLRSVLSQRIHDQPKQQALRIRSLLGHWQHKLKVEAERDPEGKVVVQPIAEALGKVRKISEELEGGTRLETRCHISLIGSIARFICFIICHFCSLTAKLAAKAAVIPTASIRACSSPSAA